MYAYAIATASVLAQIANHSSEVKGLNIKLNQLAKPPSSVSFLTRT